MTAKLLLGKMLGSSSNAALTNIASVVPNDVHIESLGVDICDEIMSVAVASKKRYTLIGGILSVEGIKGKLSFLMPTRAIEFSIQTSWKIGNLDFQIEALKKDGNVIIKGRPVLSPEGSSIAKVINKCFYMQFEN